MKLNLEMVGSRVECTTCHRQKAPKGRSVPVPASGMYCDDECPGYRKYPQVSSLWPGELRDVCDRCGSGFPFHNEMNCGGKWVQPEARP